MRVSAKTARRAVAEAFACQHGRLFLWAPVALAMGIGLYFALPVEPGKAGLAIASAALLFAVALRRLMPGWALLLGLIPGGLLVAALKAHLVAAPVLEGRYYGPIEGRIVAMDRSGSDVPRLTLDRVVLGRIAAQDTPARVRVSLHSGQESAMFSPGTRVMLTGHLTPPNGAAQPGGFDFRRHAWFGRIGAVGYTRVPAVVWAGPEGVPLARWRMLLSRRVQEGLAGEPGALAAAILTGDRSSIDAQTYEILRKTNLAHLLAISGLHMGLLAGFVFALLWRVMALRQQAALALPLNKYAALGALAAAAGYLALSGGNVATQRAFVMVSVGLVAIVAERQAVSLRAVALAALIVLVLRPEALLGPGFQMSFAATVALVWVFGLWRRFDIGQTWPKWARVVSASVLSSAVAGAATAPVAAAHFNMWVSYGLLANVISVPLMAVLIMPAGALALALMPLGLEAVPLYAMALGLRWILAVAQEISQWPGAVYGVPTPPAGVLAIAAFGVLWLMLWRGRLRYVGVFPAFFAAIMWVTTAPPVALVSQTGKLVALRTPDGALALSRTKGEGFVARIWLENDGSLMQQDQAAQLWMDLPMEPLTDREGAKDLRKQVPLMNGKSLFLLRGKRAAKERTECNSREILISDQVLTHVEGECEKIDALHLQRSGSLAFREGGGILSANAIAGKRLWTPDRRPDQ